MIRPKPRLDLPRALADAILEQARAAFPRECCGLLAGTRCDTGAHVMALHPARNIASRDDRFEIDPRDHFAAMKVARGAGQHLIGCYHSHPNGRAALSDTDKAGAGEANFFWLIAAGAELAAFVYLHGLWVGAETVTSSS